MAGTTTTLDCPECGAPAGRECEISCIADQAEPPALVHLQYCGDFPGTPAGEIQAGDCLAWNYGTVYDVVSAHSVSPQFVKISERKHGETDGQVYARRLRKDRLVVRCVPDERRGIFTVR